MLQNHPLALQKLREIHQESESMQRIIQTDSITIDSDYCKHDVNSNFSISQYRCKLDNEFEITGDWEKLTLNSTQQYGIQKKPCK
jgi:hypothetical protein